MSTENLNKLNTDEEHGIVFGFAMVSKANGEDFFDSQGDNIPIDSAIRASVDFMNNSRIAKEMHDGDGVGTVPFMLPITDEIRKFISETNMTGVMIGMLPSKEVFNKFKSGEFTGFSIGGEVKESEEV